VLADTARDTTSVRLCYSVFFAVGFVAVLDEPLVFKLREMFSLSFADAMLTQMAFFLGYFVFSIPFGILLTKLGYVRCIALGLAVMACGCALFAWAAGAGTYTNFLIALFVVAAGVTMLQVSANPYITILHSGGSAGSRLTLAQAFNSLGRVIGPLVGAVFFLRGGGAVALEEVDRAADVSRSQLPLTAGPLPTGPFWVIAALLLVLATIFWLRRGVGARLAGAYPLRGRVRGRLRLLFGVLAIFLYVGAEVSIGSGLTNYLMQRSVLGNQAGLIGSVLADIFGGPSRHAVRLNGPQIAGAMVSIYWGFAMVGRFVGAAVLAHVEAGRVLFAHAVVATVLALISSQSEGVTAAVSVLAIGLANSVMFPAIFTIALQDLGDDTPKGSALLCLALVGGAVVPLLYGVVADHYGLSAALLVPAICYAAIATYGASIGRTDHKVVPK